MCSISISICSRLGTYPKWKLNVTEMVTLWELCRYDASLSNDFSHFCSMWTDDDVSDLAYLEDLQTYYQNGYGHDLNWEIATDIMDNVTSNIFLSFAQINEIASQCGQLLPPTRRRACKELLQNAPYQKAASFRFATTESLLPVLAWLGLFATSSEIMQYDTPVNERDEREWRTSRLAAYSSNVIFLSYVCENERGNETLIKVVFNEEDVQLPGCGGRVYCNMTTFMEGYQSKLAIDYNQICGLTQSDRRKIIIE